VPAIVTDESLLINGVNFAKQSVGSLPEVAVESLSSLGMSCSSFTRQVTHLPVGLYCGSGDIVTVVGALPVAINANRHGQTHWQVPKNEWGFLEDIGVVAITDDARTVVVCEKAPASMSSAAVAEKFDGRVFTYNASTGINLSQFPSLIKGGTVAASFSPDNRTLGLLACDSHHSLTIFSSVTGDWKDPSRLFTGQVDVNPVTLIASILQSPSNAEFQYVTGGRGRLRFWKLRGRNVVSSACETSSNEAVTALLSIDPGQVIIGDKAGGLSLWDGKLCLQTIPNCHVRRVSALCKYDTRASGSLGTYGFISASSDLVRVWSNSMEPLQELVIDEILHRVNRVTDAVYVTSMCTDSIFKRLLLTLSSSLILEVSVDSKAVLLVTEGHMSGSFVALAAHPKETRILITGGYDGWVKCWDIRSPAAMEVMHVGEPITSLLLLEDGHTLIVALTDTLLILDFSVQAASKFTVLHKLAKLTKSVISIVRSAPDQSVLVVGSTDGSIVVLDPDNKYAVAHTLKGHAKAIEGMDFSLNGKYLRSFSRASENESSIETVFHLMEKGSRATYEMIFEPEDLVEVAAMEWVTVSSPAAPEGRGTLETVNQMKASEQGVVFKNAAVSRDRKLMAVGYSDGLVRLFRYLPSLPPPPPSLLS
jgi:WD40 repeat protein